jgi:integral membrane protein
MNRPFLKGLIALGIIEGTSTLVLFGIAMPLKYMADMPMAVSIAGAIHGMLFVALVGMFLWGRSAIPLSNKLVGWGIVGAILPFGPFIVDVPLYKMLKEGKVPH